ncbi:MAG: lipid II flippase MurJ, partial [Planctomycetaceae bacterium]
SCSRLIRFAAVLLLPASALVLLAGHSLLPTLSLNALDQQDCQRLGWTLGGYAWGLFPEMAGLALVQAVLVLGRFKHLAIIGLLGLFLPNLILNLLLINPLQELGLALSTSATAWLLLAVAWWAVQTTIGLDDPKGILLAVAYAAALSLVALLAGWSTANALGPHPLAALTAIAVAATTYLGLALIWPGLPDLKLALQAWNNRDHA